MPGCCTRRVLNRSSPRGAKDAGLGLEAIAEDGNAAPLGTSLGALDGYLTGAIFNTPVGTGTPGPLLPGSKYQFTFDGSPGDSLSFVSMLAATNDVFLAPKDVGIPLFDANDVALNGDISDRVFLWDAARKVTKSRRSARTRSAINRQSILVRPAKAKSSS